MNKANTSLFVLACFVVIFLMPGIAFRTPDITPVDGLLFALAWMITDGTVDGP